MDCALLTILLATVAGGALVLYGISVLSTERAKTIIWGELTGDAARWYGVAAIVIGMATFFALCVFIYAMPS
jgi:hypothetical protein